MKTILIGTDGMQSTFRLKISFMRARQKDAGAVIFNKKLHNNKRVSRTASVPDTPCPAQFYFTCSTELRSDNNL